MAIARQARGGSRTEGSGEGTNPRAYQPSGMNAPGKSRPPRATNAGVMSAPPRASLDTLCIHAGQEPDPISGAVMTPIVLSSTFAQDGPGVHKGYDYSRAGNPTRTALEQCLAALEGATHGIAFGSGCAATTAVLLTLKSGDHVLVGDDVYGGTFRIFDKVLKQFGVDATFLDMSDPARVREAMRPNTRLVWMETPSNPMLKVFDVAAIAEVARTRGIPLAVDNTFATPMLQQPLALGATLVVHSTTKYLNGHSDVVGGAVHDERRRAGREAPLPPEVRRRRAEPVRLLPRPARAQDARRAHAAPRRERARASRSGWRATRGSRACATRGLASHEGHALAARQMKGPGGMISFDLRGHARPGERRSSRRCASSPAPRASAASSRSPSTRPS